MHSEPIGEYGHAAANISTVYGVDVMGRKIHISCAGYAWYMGSEEGYYAYETRTAVNPDYDRPREYYEKVRRLVKKNHATMILDRGALGSYSTK